MTAEWIIDAACVGMDPALFVLGAKEDRYSAEARDACARCPVAGECLDDALATNNRTGLRGGLSPKQRAKIRGERDLSRVLQCAGCYRRFVWVPNGSKPPRTCSAECWLTNRHRNQARSRLKQRVGA